MDQLVLPQPPDLARIREEAGRDPAAVPPLIRRLVEEHGVWNHACLNLVASHNYLSPGAKALLSSSVADHILSGMLGMRNHAGGAWIEAIDTVVVELCKKIFGATWVEYRAMSGAMANGLVLAGLTRPGDNAVAQSPRQGGHHTYREDAYAGVLGLRLDDIPYHENGEDIDLDRLEDLVRRVRPKLLIVGSAVILFRYPLRELRAIADLVGAKLHYDGAHILGLAAGGEFQDPLREGAAILTGSGQKTLGGPIGGLILTTDEEAGTRIPRITSELISNYHNNRIAALAITLAEIAQFGREFAAQIVRNARALAKSLDREGMPVLGKEKGFTDTHIVLLDATRMPVGLSAFRQLEQARILSTRIPLPTTYPERHGIRLGTAAVTRLGMDESVMAEIATLIRRAVTGEPPAAVAAHVTELARSYDTVRYCF